MDTQPKRLRKWLVVGAATGSSSSTASTAATAAAGASGTSATPGGPPRGVPNPAAMSHGPGETLLTGTTAAQVKAAALAAVPGATIIRVETDSAGSPYEAHLTKSDGTQVTLKIDAAFKVTATEQGFGAGPGGHAPPGA